MKILKIILTTINLLFASLTLHAQSTADKVAIARAKLVVRALPQEHVYLHFDNSCYYLGETIWFKAFVTSGNNDIITNQSRVLYVELVSPEGYVVKTNKYNISSNGTCHGDIYMEPNYLSGFYEIRAYTRYMLNRGDEAVFSRVFPVYDQVKNGDWSFRNMLKRPRRFIKDGIWNYEEDIRCDLKFYPEGGHLVNGIEGVVAFELLGEGGKPAENDGVIKVYEGKKELLTVHPIHAGKGIFAFTPQSGMEYHATVLIKDKTGKEKKYRFDLPKIEDEGVVLAVSTDEKNIKMSVRNNYPARTGLSIAVLHRGCVEYYSWVARTDTTVTVDANSLPEGVCRAIVFNGEVPLAERQFFVRHTTMQPDDRQTVRLHVTANGTLPHKLNLAPHEKITVTVEREDGKPIEQDCEFALSVVDLAGKQKTSWAYNMYTYLLLGSELKGYIPDVQQYFDPKNEKRNSQLDLIMLTHGWTSYDWSKLTATTVSDIVPPERGLYIRGRFIKRLRSKKNGKLGSFVVHPQPFNQVRMDYTLGDKIITTAFRTDNKGEFTVEVDSFNGRQIVALSPRTLMKQSETVNYAFSLDRYFSPTSRFYHYMENHLSEDKLKFGNYNEIKAEYVGMNEYMLSDFEVIAKKDTRFYAPPNSEMRLDYLDEWEYAMDVTYIYDRPENAEIEREKNIMFRNAVADKLFALGNTEINEDSLSEHYSIYEDSRRKDLYQYYYCLTAQNVLQSALARHGLQNGWVQPIVIKGGYKSDSQPIIDEEFLHGINAEKMLHFKEIVITSNREKCKVIDGGAGEAFEQLKLEALNNKGKHSLFYEGFLSVGTPLAVFYPGWDKDEFTETYMRANIQRTSNGHFMAKGRNDNPDHLACFVPYSAEDSIGQHIIPDYSNGLSTRRYTSLQGYSENKQFYSPNYSNMKPEDMDYRRTLLWSPTVKVVDGKLNVVLYNNSECCSLDIEVAGWNGSTIYSNDDVLEERELAKDSIDLQLILEDKKSNSYMLKRMSDEQCRKEFDKAEIYFKQKRYGKCINTYIELVQYGYLPAYYRVGHSYKHGLGLAKNDTLALRFFKYAAEKGDAKSQYEYAVMLMNGEGSKTAPVQAKEWLEKAAYHEYAVAQTELAKYYLNGIGTMPDTLAAGRLLKKAAINGYSEAIYEYGLYMARNGVEKDSVLGTAVECISKSAEDGFQPAMKWLLDYYDTKEEYSRAYVYAKKLYILKDVYGTRYMADCYRYGRGVKRDKRLAKDLYRDAAGLGCKESEKILQEW